MARETPKWLQAGTYAARLDRHVIEEVFRRQNRVMRGLQVVQRVAGANFSVDITAGSGVVIGTTQPDQGGYMIRSDAAENFVVPATPVVNRTDSIYAQVRDPNAGGPAGSDWLFVYVASGSPAPADSVKLADITRTTSESAILTAAIIDRRPLGEWSWTIVTATPTHNAPDGDLAVQVSP